MRPHLSLLVWHRFQLFFLVIYPITLLPLIKVLILQTKTSISGSEGVWAECCAGERDCASPGGAGAQRAPKFSHDGKGGKRTGNPLSPSLSSYPTKWCECSYYVPTHQRAFKHFSPISMCYFFFNSRPFLYTYMHENKKKLMQQVGECIYYA